MSLLQTEGLTRTFGGIHAIENLDFQVEPGPIQAVIGPNGAGKTTLFNLLSGLYQPSAGRVAFDGDDILGQKPYQLARRGLGRTFQNLQVCHNMSALENVMIGRHLHLNGGLLPAMLRLPGLRRADAACREKAAELMEFVGIGDYREAEANAMPYGALKRLEIARALAAEPRLLLLDEPAAGLNPRETEEIGGIIRKIAESGVTVLLVEHDMKLVMGVAERILVLDYGKKLAEGSAEEIR
ncbi:MAG: ABC transporter ATP-binding protein, partial [Pseudomonadota bacterium]|nr:ABC transporter ATP-binding protein [Pseudomonadota bacterium]